jgi:hypothetical protein
LKINIKLLIMNGENGINGTEGNIKSKIDLNTSGE